MRINIWDLAHTSNGTTLTIDDDAPTATAFAGSYLDDVLEQATAKGFTTVRIIIGEDLCEVVREESGVYPTLRYLGSASTSQHPQPVDEYRVDEDDPSIHNWAIDLDGVKHNADGVTQWGAIERVREIVEARDRARYGCDFNSATLDWAEWNSGQIKVWVQSEWWQGKTVNGLPQDLGGRMTTVTVTPR